ncbi:MAG: cobalamin-binding protein [Gammaproteobacteria bacterium]|nr:cobalamin-binding protein [Gammaproteobacteria bacterium]
MVHRFLICIGLLVSLFSLNVNAISVIDDVGQEIVLKGEARRIIALAPHIVEQLFEIGAGDKIVGTVSYSDYPDAAKSIPVIGGYNRFDMEAIIALKPDLVIGWSSGNSVEQIEQLKRLGITLFLDEPRKIDDIAKTMERFGLLTGREELAREAAKQYRNGFFDLREKSKGKAPAKLFYQLWHRPLMTVNGEHIINDILELCGGENIFSVLPALTPVVSREAVIAANPQLIITSGMDNMRSASQADWLEWKSMRAVKGGNVYHINPDIIHRATPRILEGATMICQFIESAQ